MLRFLACQQHPTDAGRTDASPSRAALQTALWGRLPILTHRGRTGKRIHVPAVPQAKPGGLLIRSAQPAAQGHGAGLGQRGATGG